MVFLFGCGEASRTGGNSLKRGLATDPKRRGHGSPGRATQGSIRVGQGRGGGVVDKTPPRGFCSRKRQGTVGRLRTPGALGHRAVAGWLAPAR